MRPVVVEGHVLVDLVGDDHEVVLDADLGDRGQLLGDSTAPVGLCGQLMSSTRVRGVTARRSSSGSRA